MQLLPCQQLGQLRPCTARSPPAVQCIPRHLISSQSSCQERPGFVTASTCRKQSKGSHQRTCKPTPRLASSIVSRATANDGAEPLPKGSVSVVLLAGGVGKRM
eukprot:898875-Pelagomonas_calceolata.AAC.1